MAPRLWEAPYLLRVKGMDMLEIRWAVTAQMAAGPILWQDWHGRTIAERAAWREAMQRPTAYGNSEAGKRYIYDW